jgi:ADP-heptose:LPS heptosyltransferase
VISVGEPASGPLLERMAFPPRKVAVLRASRIGDLLMAIPALRSLRAALPDAEMCLIGHPGAGELAERIQYVDRFIALPIVARPSGGWMIDPAQGAPFITAMRAEQFDLALQLHGYGLNANPLTMMLGARYTAGFDTLAGPAGRLDAAFPRPVGVHEVRRLLDFMAFLGVPDRGDALEFPLSDGDRREAAALLGTVRHPLIGIHGGAQDAAKRWPAGRFAEAGAELSRRLGGTVVAVGAANARYAELVARIPNVPVLDLTGRTSLLTLAGVIERLHLLVCNDSAPAHIAYALGIPSVTIFGPTDPREWGPPANPRHRVLPQPYTTGDVRRVTVTDVLDAVAY